MIKKTIGLQLGAQATDFVLLVMNPRGAESILKSKVKLGADAAAAAGPKGRDATAATDGRHARRDLEGSTLRQDNGANEKIYGRKIEASDIIRKGAVPCLRPARSWSRS